MFAAAMKDGTPVFVLNGTGGAADRIALLIQHMRWRKRLIELGGDKQDEVDAQQATDKQSRAFPRPASLVALSRFRLAKRRASISTAKRCAAVWVRCLRLLLPLASDPACPCSSDRRVFPVEQTRERQGGGGRRA
eukprot:1879601-Rhodomonas_salina.1